MVLEFVKSQRGKPKLRHEGYSYCLLRKKDGLKTWRCDKRQCKAIATTFEDNVFTTREHLPEPDMKHSEQLKILEKMKEKAANSNEQPGKIVQDTTALITRECAVALPNARAWPEAFKGNVGAEITLPIGHGVRSPNDNKILAVSAKGASLRTALQEYAQEKFCQSMLKWSVTASVNNFSTIIKIIICCLF